MSYILDPPVLFIMGMILLLIQKFFNVKHKTMAVIGIPVVLLFVCGSALLYLDVIRWPIPDTQGSIWMFHTDYTGIRKENVPAPLVVAMLLIYPLWLYLGYVVAERLMNRHTRTVIVRPSSKCSNTQLTTSRM